MKKHLLSLLALAALTSATVAQVPSYVPSNGLVGWWPFNGNANDGSGNGNNGAVNGATLTTDRFGNANSAYDFDGNGDRITVLHNNSLNFESANSFSVSYWINSSVTNSSFVYFLISKQVGAGITQDGWNTIINSSSGAIDFRVMNGSGTPNCFPSSQAVQSNVYFHIVCTYGAGVASIYVNGSLVVSQNCSAVIGNNLANMIIGDLHDGSVDPFARGFSGKLDDIGLWNRTINPCEIQQLYIAQSIVQPTASISYSGNTSICEGDLFQLTASSGDQYLWNTGEDTQTITVTEAGSYTVTVTNGGACSSTSEPITVTVNPKPTVTLASIAALCANASAVALTGGSPAGGSYTVNGTPATTLNPAQTGSGQQTVAYTFTDGNGCSNTATQNATVNAVPSVSLSGLNTAYLPTDAPVQLNGSPAGGVFNGTGVSNGQFDPAAAGLGTHGVKYTVVDANGCVGGQALCTTVDLTTGSGIGLDNGGNGVEVYPNPSNGLFTVVMDGMDGIVQLSVMDIRGREVASQSLTARGRTTHSIDLSGFASGVYTLRIQSAKGVNGMKLVKE